MENKCRYCTKRFVGCHSQCDDYKEYRKKYDEEKERIRKSKASYTARISFITYSQYSMRKKRRGFKGW